jgi:2-hydroxychromene-2-carboxylate isomerase
LPEPTTAFCFDLGSPAAYLAAERIVHLLPAAQWRPVLGAELGAGAAAEAEAFRCEHEHEAFREDIERRARELGLLPVRWPDPFPFDSRPAMLAATYAAGIGRAVAFAQAAFRQAFAGGRSLADPDSILIAAAACEMHPKAVQQALERRSIAAELARTTAGAAAAGVDQLPAVLVGGRVFAGERGLGPAARANEQAA